MFANRFAKTSHGISYPFLYLNSAASLLALVTDARASAIDPVMTQPTDDEILKTYDTDEGSMSLSLRVSEVRGLLRKRSGLTNDIREPSFVRALQHSSFL